MASTFKVIFLIPVLWSFTCPVEGCLVNCVCSLNKYLEKVLTCRNISTIPDNIPADIQILLMDENTIENITGEKFENLTVLRLLMLSGNQIRHVRPGTLKSLTSVKTIHLERNNITRLERGFLKECIRLFDLNLSQNQIKVLEPGTFLGLHSLILLNLSRNAIQVIQPGAFTDLYFLSFIELSFNQIHNVTRDMFLGAPYLMTIFLKNNKIKVIPQGAFGPSKFLSSLYLEDNGITDIASEAFKDNDFLQLLRFINNNITHLREDVFNNLPNLKTLILSENKIEAINPGLFRGLSRLTRLHLDNNHLTHIEERTFTHIPQINTITLHKNRLRSLATAVLANLTNLVYLSLQKNQLTDIPNIKNKTFMQQLFLTSNRIKYIPTMQFRTNTKLINIFLDTNMVERLYNHSFYGAVSLKTITLVENPLAVIEEGAFLSLPNLIMVSLINSFVVTPLVIWPTLLPPNISFAVSQSDTMNTSSLDLGIKLRNIEAGFLVSTLGYSCPEYLGPSSDTCYPCGRGHYIPSQFYACKTCPPGGFYQDEIGYIGEEIFGIRCKQCPHGTFVKPEMAPGKSRTDCRSCPQGTYLRTFAKFRACSCMEEYYRLDRYGRCFVCTKGYVCENEGIDLAAGFYWIWQANQQQDYKQFKKDLLLSDGSHKYPVFRGVISKAYACPIAEACLGGEQSRCKQGYTGPLCAVCEKGYIQMMTNCQLCPTLPWIITQMVLVAVLVIVLVAITLCEKKKDAGSSSRSLTDILLARLKIVVGFYQVSSATFDSFSYISWPGPVVTIMKYAKMVQFNLLQIAPLSCINDAIKTDAYTRFLSSMVITAVVIIFGVSFHFILRVYSARNKIEESTLATEEREIKINQYKQKCYRCLLLILFITFPSNFTHVVQVLPATCHKICSSGDHDCKSYLKADYSIQCNTAKHNLYSSVSYAALVYCVGFPLVLFLILRNGKKMQERHGESSVHNNDILNGIRFLYENYSADCWFWEIVELVRKIVFTCILVLMAAESRLSLGLTSILSGLYSVMFALYKPIDDLFEHWLQLASLMASSVNFSAGMLMKIPEDENSSGVNKIDGIVLTVLLVTANVAVVAIVAVKYIASIVTTLISLKEEPRCDVSCCLEVLQVVIDAQGELTDAWNEPTVTANPVLEQTVDDVTAYAGEEQHQGDNIEGEEEEEENHEKERENAEQVMNKPSRELQRETGQEAQKRMKNNITIWY